MKNQKITFTAIVLALGSVAFLPQVHAVIPTPDGCYPNFTTAEGCKALQSLTTGPANTAVGWFSLFSNTDGSFNTALGAGTLLFNIGDQNAFEGVQNTAIGAAALLFNTIGSGNTATGTAALLDNTEGNFNTAVGNFALSANTIGFENTATGAGALSNNTSGAFNTVHGARALATNSTGDDNTATGAGALFNNVDGSDNTAVGLNALGNNTSGDDNVAVGRNAGNQQTTGSNNIYIGSFIGGVAGENNSCYIGSIFNQLSSGGTAVFVNANHKLGTMTSSKRFKDEIKPMAEDSEELYALNPVTFRYKKDIDPARASQFGLVAEDVEKVNPDLVVRDKEGKPYSVRYDQVNAMLLNEFLKEHRKVKELESRLAQQEKQIESLSAGLQKVSAQLEMSRPDPRMVAND
jgi:Chaperone of endosialidase